MTRETRLVANGESGLRLQTIVRLRWLAIFGQLVTVCVVRFVLDFPVDIANCFIFIALSAWLNVFLGVRFPARHRLGTGFATIILAYDILQLAALLYLTGGVINPFAVLIIVPVMVSAATLPPRNTILLGLLATAATIVLVDVHLPLPWRHGFELDLPVIYRLGVVAAICSSMVFLSLYSWRLAKEARQMTEALTATELVLAREQKLHALDELAAAAAHELGTPLSTITLVAKELEHQLGDNSAVVDDLALLHDQAKRCQEILQKLTVHQSAADPLFGTVTVGELLEEAAGPYRELGKTIDVGASAVPGIDDIATREPFGQRRPGMIYGLGNIVENAVEFANTRVLIHASWTGDFVTIVIADDGPGFPADLIDTLGEPYVSRRSGARRGRKAKGLGLGFFIAKTLLERSGATVTLQNKPPPRRGAMVRIEWPRASFEARVERTANGRSPAPGDLRVSTA